MMGDLKPYRVEWRTDLTSNWTLIESMHQHENALGKMAASVAEWGGQARVVAQHVIEVRGLGEPAEKRGG